MSSKQSNSKTETSCSIIANKNDNNETYHTNLATLFQQAEKIDNLWFMAKKVCSIYADLATGNS